MTSAFMKFMKKPKRGMETTMINLSSEEINLHRKMSLKLKIFK
jgi:hypothetical protein